MDTKKEPLNEAQIKNGASGEIELQPVYEFIAREISKETQYDFACLVL